MPKSTGGVDRHDLVSWCWTLGLVPPLSTPRICEQGESELVICQTDRHALDGARKLFVSHEVRRHDLRGLDSLPDAAGRKVATIACIERPLMFPGYLRMAPAYDLGNPHGKAGCVEPPPHEK